MAAARHVSPPPKEPSMFSLLSGWGQQGVQTLFATQRILLDLAMRQNASVMHAVRQQLSDPHRSPAAILSEVAEEGIANFLEGQKVLLELGKQQNDILMSSVKERIGVNPQLGAMVALLQRSVETFIQMHEEYLKIVSKQSRAWLDSAKTGKPYQPEHAVGLAREGLENFVKAQKKFLDVIAEEAGKATTGKPTNGAAKKAKPTELSQLARQSTEALLEAQKRLVDVAGRQINAGAQAAGKTLDIFKPFPFIPLNELTREVVKSYVEAQKQLMDVVVKSPAEHRAKKPVKKAKAAAAVA